MKIIFCVFVCFLISFSAYPQHSILMKNGEKMTGEVQSIKEGNITFIFHGNTMSFKVADVSAIYFSPDPAPVPVSKTNVAEPSGTKGVQFVMNGRKLIKQPKIENLTLEKGTVVVEITINKYGNVIKANPGAEGTNTTSNYLLTKAKQAAESVQFDTSPVMPLEEKGTITIVF